MSLLTYLLSHEVLLITFTLGSCRFDFLWPLSSSCQLCYSLEEVVFAHFEQFWQKRGSTKVSAFCNITFSEEVAYDSCLLLLQHPFFYSHIFSTNFLGMLSTGRFHTGPVLVVGCRLLALCCSSAV